MSTPNLVSASVTPANKTTLLGIGAQIKTLLPFLIAKTNEERQKGFKLGDGTLAFLEKSSNYANQNPALVPSYLNLPEMTKDTLLASDLDQILKSLEPVIQNVIDTYQEAGAEALTGALIFYNNVKLAAHNNVPGAQVIYDDLKEQFPGRTKKKTTPPAV